MLSRVADSIYWMSRYIERAENVARFIAVNLNLSMDLPGQSSQQWYPLVVTTGALGLVFAYAKTFGETYGSLAGLVALQLWTFFSALAILFGVAVAAQLEAVRAGPAAAREAPPQEAAAVTRPVSA